MAWGMKLAFVAVAIAIIGGIIWDSRHRRGRNRRHHRDLFLEPMEEKREKGDLGDVVIVKKTASLITPMASAEASIPEEVISLMVMAEPGEVFEGEAIDIAAKELNLRLGERHIYHRHENHDGSGGKLFSMASALKPGSFEKDEFGQFATPGLSLFLMQTLPGKSVVAFEMMLRTARQLAQKLGGELWNDQRQALTPEGIEDYRIRIKALSQRYKQAN